MRLQARLTLDDELLVRAGRGLARGEQPVPASEAARIEDEVRPQIVDSVPLALPNRRREASSGRSADPPGLPRSTAGDRRSRRRAVSVVALCTVAFTSIPDGVDDAQIVSGAIGPAPQADPGLIERCRRGAGLHRQDLPQIEGLYTGYVRSVAMGGSPGPDRVMR